MNYLITLSDKRQFEVTANNINQAAILAVQVVAKVPAGRNVILHKPRNLLNWWGGVSQECAVVFKIKPLNWKNSNRKSEKH